MDQVPETRPSIGRARKLDCGKFVGVPIAWRLRDLDDGIPRPVSGRADVTQPTDAVVDQASRKHQNRLHRAAGSGAGGARGGTRGGRYLRAGHGGIRKRRFAFLIRPGPYRAIDAEEGGPALVAEVHDNKLVLGNVLEYPPLTLFEVTCPAYPIVGLEDVEQGVAIAAFDDVAEGDIRPSGRMLMTEDLLHWVIQVIVWRVHDGATNGRKDSLERLSKRGGHIEVRYISSSDSNSTEQKELCALTSRRLRNTHYWTPSRLSV